MNAFAISTLLLLAGALVMLILTWKYRWSAKPPDIPRDPRTASESESESEISHRVTEPTEP